MQNKYLEDFKKLLISKKELSDKLGGNLITLTVNNPVIINTIDVISLLYAYKTSEITLQHLLDWVNIVWFTDLFDYNECQRESIASVLDKLEELDEDGKKLTNDDIDKYINALLSNKGV